MTEPLYLLPHENRSYREGLFYTHFLFSLEKIISFDCPLYITWCVVDSYCSWLNLHDLRKGQNFLENKKYLQRVANSHLDVVASRQHWTTIAIIILSSQGLLSYSTRRKTMSLSRFFSHEPIAKGQHTFSLGEMNATSTPLNLDNCRCLVRTFSLGKLCAIIFFLIF